MDNPNLRLSGETAEREGSPSDDFAGAALARELHVIVSGTGQGVKDSFQNFADHPLESGLKFGGALMVGAGLTAFECYARESRPAQLIMYGALGSGFLTGLAPRLSSAWSALVDASSSDVDVDKDTKQFGDAAGSFVFDSLLYWGVGRGSSALTEKYLLGAGGYTRLPTLQVGQSARAALYERSEPLAQLYSDKTQSIVRISRDLSEPRAGVSLGTGFFARADGTILTNAHVIDNDSSNLCATTASGKRYALTVRAVDPQNDIAILQVQGALEGDTFKPLTIASELPERQEAVVMMGFPDKGKGKMFMSPGNYVNHFDDKLLVRIPQDINLPFGRNIISDARLNNAELGEIGQAMHVTLNEKGVASSITPTSEARPYYAVANRPHLNFSMHVDAGNSGSPIMNMKGEVIGLTRGRVGNTWGTASPGRSVQEFLDDDGRDHS